MTKKELLEKRLEIVSPQEFEMLKLAFQVPHINPQANWREMPYLKEDLANAIASYLAQNSDTNFHSFKQALYRGPINKEPLKRVYYGLRSLGKVPRVFFNALTNWEKVYFLGGRWVIRNPNLNLPLDVITIEHLRQGLDNLHKHHYIRKANGQYERDIKLPESDEIRACYKRIMQAYNAGKVVMPNQTEQEILDNIRKLENLPSDERVNLEERICIWIQDLPDNHPLIIAYNKVKESLRGR
ncbi:MAG: hypothetical protein QW622_02240 [Candidatus Pacearchaeota archaeon]